MNIYEISEKAGVSIATVSRVLNNNPNVNEKTRKKIQAIINESNFAPTKPGKKHRPKKTIGILCNSINNPRSSEIIENILTNLHTMNFDVIIANCTDLNEKRISLQHFCELDVTAIVIDGTDFLSYEIADDSYILQAANETPIILLNSYMEHKNIYSFLCNEGETIFNITEDFIKQGKNNIIFLFSSMSAYCTPLVDAFSQAHYVHNLETSPEQIHLCSRDFNISYEYVRNLLNSSKTIDAVITTDDVMALGAIKAVKEAGLSVPNDVEVVGLGNTFLSNISNLSSINCQSKDISDSVIKTISGIFNNEKTPSRIIFPAEVVKRGTSK